MEATTDRLSGFPGARFGRVLMFFELTATMTAMLLAAIIVPIVHKTSFKKAANQKFRTKPFIYKQLLFLIAAIHLGGETSRISFP